jgi:hypothetical protein
MENVTVWYLTDNEHGEKAARAIGDMRISVNRIPGLDLSDANILTDDINIFIFDISGSDPAAIIEYCSSEQRIQGFPKFLMINRKDLRTVTSGSFNIYHLEFISRPVAINEFLLLLEKCIMLERYRQVMSSLSMEARNRLEIQEGLMDINRNNIFESGKGKDIFEDIISHEKNLLKQQSQLNRSIKDLTAMREEELFDLRRRIHAEEMLAGLRTTEMSDARNIINAQENVIDYSSRRLEETKEIFSASERVAELGRLEAMELRDALAKEKEMNATLAGEIDRLLQEMAILKGRV